MGISASSLSSEFRTGFEARQYQTGKCDLLTLGHFCSAKSALSRFLSLGLPGIARREFAAKLLQQKALSPNADGGAGRPLQGGRLSVS